MLTRHHKDFRNLMSEINVLQKLAVFDIIKVSEQAPRGTDEKANAPDNKTTKGDYNKTEKYSKNIQRQEH